MSCLSCVLYYSQYSFAFRLICAKIYKEDLEHLLLVLFLSFLSITFYLQRTTMCLTFYFVATHAHTHFGLLLLFNLGNKSS